MKQLKFLMVALTILMGVSLTSCINSESDPYEYGYGFAKVSTGMFGVTFVSGDVKVTPSSASVNKLLDAGVDVSKMDGDLVYISYRWDSTLLEIPAGSKNISGVELTSALNVTNTTEIVEKAGNSNDSVNAAPIIYLGSPRGSDVKPVFYDQTTLLLPVNYFMYGKVHYLTLKYYPDTESETLKLYLTHNNKGDESTTANSYNYFEQGYLPFFYKAYDLTDIFYRYMNDNHIQARPTTVEIVTKENPYSPKITDEQTKENTYTVTYKAATDK